MKKTTESSTKKADKVTKPKTRTAQVQFILKNPTKGALRFQEVDEQDNVRESMDDNAIGSLYVRKAFLDRMGITGCESCDVTINFHE
jgi:hypothetical protein